MGRLQRAMRQIFVVPQPPAGRYGRTVTKGRRGPQPSMKSIYTTQSLPEAGLLQAILRDHGIEAVIDNASSPIPAAAPPTLLVADANEEEALRVIREHLGQNAP